MLAGAKEHIMAKESALLSIALAHIDVNYFLYDLDDDVLLCARIIMNLIDYSLWG